ncbi:unannotated protein [freshwater metagenome]|uniref:Unannotated protein n=1 Tax=freshwater metagenome TaxID=449393 RepID=A0A6J7DHQ0_9ZZZZ|nr:hypothetical protein [Actinomycetota bacterium]MUH58178.1 hypothetical protein [Actinomycetota bacterium]
MGLRSIDSPRRRPAPTTAHLTDSAGVTHVLTLEPRTLIVAVKSNCDGCRPFVEDLSIEFSDWRLIVVTRDPKPPEAGHRTVWFAPELMDDLEVVSAPFFVALDGSPLNVVTEGVVFAPEQVAREISEF